MQGCTRVLRGGMGMGTCGWAIRGYGVEHLKAFQGWATACSHLSNAAHLNEFQEAPRCAELWPDALGP